MKLNINTDRVLGVSAMIISLVTLLIFLYQTDLMRTQSRLSVRPRLTFSKNVNKSTLVDDSSSVTTITIQLFIRNNGLGPAIVESFQVVDKGEKHDIMEFFDKVYPPLKELGIFKQISDLTVGEAIPITERVNLFTYEYDQENEASILEALGENEPYSFPFNIVVTYSSLYEELWKVSSNSEGHPQKLND